MAKVSRSFLLEKKKSTLYSVALIDRIKKKCSFVQLKTVLIFLATLQPLVEGTTRHTQVGPILNYFLTGTKLNLCLVLFLYKLDGAGLVDNRPSTD